MPWYQACFRSIVLPATRSLLLLSELRQLRQKVQKPLCMAEKCPSLSLSAVGDTSQGTSSLIYVTDKLAAYRYLVDTGAEVSVFPPTRQNRRSLEVATLQVANGSRIATYSLRSLTFNIGLRRTFEWVFIIADVDHPILGSDFSSYLNLDISVHRRSLVNSRTMLALQGVT